MAEDIVLGKRKLCYTELSDFCDIQVFGKDPLYRRFNSVDRVVKKSVDSHYSHFLAQPIYSAADDLLYWYIEKGEGQPVRFQDLSAADQSDYQKIKNDTIVHFKDKLASLSGEDKQLMDSVLKYISDDFIYCCDGKVYLVAWGMTPDLRRHDASGIYVHDCPFAKKFKIKFDCGRHGSIRSSSELYRYEGVELNPNDVPKVVPNDGFVFEGWNPSPIAFKVRDNVTFVASYTEQKAAEVPHEEKKIRVTFVAEKSGCLISICEFYCTVGHVLTADELPEVASPDGKSFSGWSPDVSSPLYADTRFVAQYESKVSYSRHRCRFDAGANGRLEGNSEVDKDTGSSFSADEIPAVSPNRGYRFKGWDNAPEKCTVDNDKVFTAQYERIPWYLRFWHWLTDSGCFKWLLWLLLALLVFIIALFFFRSCNSCSHIHDSAAPVDTVSSSDLPRNNGADNNGMAHSIIGEDGSLPDHDVVSPVVDADGQMPPIQKNPGSPDIVANRLNIYFENDNVNLNQWAKDFKKVYSGDQYKIIGCDNNVKMVQLQIPENERDAIRNKINAQLPKYKFFVVDESVFQLSDVQRGSSQSRAGWHLDAVNVRKGWNITKGNSKVVVAVVDDGIDASHPMFQGRIYKPYNVFTQSGKLSCGSGHGTHVAGLAVGSVSFLSKGVAGIAPNCRLMPVQVFDNGVCTFSSITSGIMYAVHHGANVINLSLGPSFSGLKSLPVNDQKKIAEQNFKNEEKVWRKIFSIAAKKNVIIVFAAGNDDILACVPPENRTNNTLNVAAVGQNFCAAPFSNYGQGSNISAPGVHIYSAFPGNSFKFMDGTSMAAPMVTGVVALMKSLKPDITVSQALGVLQQTGKKVGDNIPVMIQVDRALAVVRSGRIPKGPVPSSVQIPASSSSCNDDAPMRRQLDELKEQRRALNKQIDELERKLKK